MSLMLEPFQRQLVTEMTAALKRAGDSNGEFYYYLLHSPTGSGKTLMAGKAIKNLLDGDPLIRVVWLTIASGDIVKQSHDTLVDKVGFDVDQLHIFESLDAFDDTKKVVFSSWNFLKATKKESSMKNFDSPFREGGIGFRDTVKEWKRIGYRVFLFIDESHHTAGSSLSQEIVGDMAIPVVLEISATPTDVKNKKISHTRIFSPDKEEVRKSGIVKSGLEVNNFNMITTQQVVSNQENYLLSAALDKLEEIKAAYKKFGLEINPLALVQCSNARADEISQSLKALKISDQEIGRHFADVKINVDRIQDPSSNVRFLLCNQAIATGWDCPRAHVLVQFIKVGAKNFEIQVIGRILRTAVRRLFGDETLDNGYVFTYFDQNVRLIDDYKKSGEASAVRLSIRAKSELLGRFNEALTKAKMKTESLMVTELAAKLGDADLAQLHQAGFKNLMKNANNIIGTGVAGYSRSVVGQRHDIIGNAAASGESVTLAVSEDYYCKDMMRKHGVSRTVFDAIVMPYIDSTLRRTEKLSIPEGLFELAAKYEGEQKEIVKSQGRVFTLLDRYSVPTDEERWKFKRCLHSFEENGSSYFVQKLSGPELSFVRNFLEIDDDIVAWFKNFDSGSACFSTVYNYRNAEGVESIHIHNPDFICLDVEGRIRTYEIKDLSEAAMIDAVTRAKLKGMALRLSDSRSPFDYSLIFVESAGGNRAKSSPQSPAPKMKKLRIDDLFEEVVAKKSKT